MNRKTLFSFRKYLSIAGVILLWGILYSSLLFAQPSKSLPLYYFEINVGSQSHFGPFDHQAEITGGYDSLYFNHLQHFRPGFKTTIPVEMAVGYYRNSRLRLEGRLGYFYQDIGLIRLNSDEEFHLAYVSTISTSLMAMLYLGNYDENLPYGFFIGLSAGCLYPIRFSMDQNISALYGIDKVVPHPQLHFSLEGCWNARITKSGVYLTLRLASDLPSTLIGSTGRFHMQEETAYSANGRGIKMYSFRLSGGIGYVF